MTTLGSSKTSASSNSAARASGRQIWLIPIVVYALIGIADGVHDFVQRPAESSTLTALPVAFCAGLFWPVDIIARRLLM